MLLYQGVIAGGNRAKPLVTGAGLQRKARNCRQQAVKWQRIIITQNIKGFLLDLRQQIVQLD